MIVCSSPNRIFSTKEFAKLYFGGAPASLVNGFIDRREDFPDFEVQLGCGGFIIFDGTPSLVTRKTLPWGEYRDRAFLDLEAKLQIH